MRALEQWEWGWGVGALEQREGIRGVVLARPLTHLQPGEGVRATRCERALLTAACLVPMRWS